MKKYLLSFLVAGSLLVVTGCGKEVEDKKEDTKVESKVMTCTLKKTVQKGVELDATYKVTYKGEDVTLLESVEKVDCDSKNVLKTYKETVENTYKPYKDVEHYEYNVETKDKTLTSTVKADYEKIDTDKLIEIDDSNKALIKDGKVKLDILKATYELLGAECKDE